MTSHQFRFDSSRRTIGTGMSTVFSDIVNAIDNWGKVISDYICTSSALDDNFRNSSQSGRF
jgi:hypothetical protein